MNTSLHCRPHNHDGSGHDHGHDHHGHDHDHHHDHNDDHDHHHDHGHDHGRSKPVRPGILLAAFGVAMAQARRGYEQMEAEVREQFPGIPVAWAYTAHKVRKKLAAMGQGHDSVAVALSRLHDDGVTHLAVQSLHTVPGVEYHWTHSQAMAFVHPRKGFREVALGAPLLTSEEDLERAALALQSYIPAGCLPDEAVVLVGHGTYHQGQQRYLDFETRVRLRDPRVFLGALMNRSGETLGVSSIISRLQEANINRCRLLPFMSVPGHHVLVDILGQSPRSWKHRLQAAGIEVLSEPTGTLEHGPFRALWMDHLRHAFASLHPEDNAGPGHRHGGHHAHI